jgi:hypothetical protein
LEGMEEVEVVVVEEKGELSEIDEECGGNG